jgi:hypothetical protein
MNSTKNSTTPDMYYGLCKFTFTDGRRCTMPVHPDFNGFCRSHGTNHRRTQYREDDLFQELASPAGDFITQIDINHVLGKLFGALAANRVSPRRAATLAYIGHLLMQSQKSARREANMWDSESKLLAKLVDIKYPGQLSQNSEPAGAKLSREGGPSKS